MFKTDLKNVKIKFGTKMILKKCKICGKEFKVLPYRKDIAKYCSYKCYWKYLKGKRVSSKTEFKKGGKGFWTGKKRENMRNKNNPRWRGGKKEVVCKVCGKKIFRYSSEIRENNFCSVKCRGKYYRGKRPWNYKGINSESKKIRHRIESQLWREAVFARDNWICQKCKEKGGKLNAHHIQNFADYPELRFAIDNGIILCKKCHQIFHKKYGVRKNTREQLNKFLCIKPNLKIQS